MAMTLAEFKKAFADLTDAPQPYVKKDALLKEGLEQQIAHLEKQRASLKADLDKLRDRMKTGLAERLKETPEPEQAQARKEALEALKLKLGETNSAYVELTKRQNVSQDSVLEARELLDELGAMLDDFLEGTGSDKLAKLLGDRMAANEKNAALKPQREPGFEPGKLDKTLAGRKEEPAEVGGTAQRSVAEAIKGRAEAQQWQEEEMKGIAKAQSALKDLDAKLKYTAWIARWKKDLVKDNAQLRNKVTEQLKKLQAARKSLAGAEKDLLALDKDLKKARDWLLENPPHDDDSPDTKRARERFTYTVEHDAEERAEPQARKDKAQQAIQDAVDAIPKAVQAVNDKVDAAARALADKSKELILLAKADPQHTDLQAAPLEVDLSKFKLAPINVDQDQAAVAAPPAEGEINVDGDKMFPAHERTANKHGTGRHGAHTGLELQARRLAATGGPTPDEAGNEWGTSKPLPGDGVPLKSITWRNQAIEWEETPAGRRKLSPKSVKAIAAEAVALPAEGTGGASSMFLNPEVEHEAVRRALDFVKAEVPKEWEQVSDKDKDDWSPLDRVVVVVGKPKGSAGYGYGLVRSDGTPKLPLDDANRLIEQFREGRLDPQQLLKLLDVALTPTDDGLGAKLMPHCKVVCDLVGSTWINTSQFPCAEPAGWSLAGKKLKLADPPGGTKDAPAFPGA